ncbi:MAG: FAD-dependent thymidylate synthase [Candidatus Diapherotrites archaeon]|nr:FAD-dependent thymidylate synthase [Candidatus Diapherotrites archaeon]
MAENSFSSEERKILEPFFSNMDKNVFVLKNLPEVVSGALFSRYSRSPKPLRRLLLDEFIADKESGFREIVNYSLGNGEQQAIATKKAEEFYDRVLVGYGDDSVAELGGAHVACEKVSIIASKVLEDSRIGLSPLEKSTRYVYFDEKEGGRYQYLLEPGIMQSAFEKDYVETCDLLFGTYAELVPKVRTQAEEWFPQDSETTDRAYKSTIKAKTCDLLRGLLPASTLTNLGLYGNGRAFEYLILKMHASPLKEINGIASSLHEELLTYIPSFVKRAAGKYGGPTQDFFRQANANLDATAKELLAGKHAEQAKEVELVDFDMEADNKIVCALLYAHSDKPLHQLKKIVAAMGEEEKRKVIHASLAHRQNRRHKPLRSFENAYYTFDLLSNYGGFRDLHRHRQLTQERQLLTANFGYDTYPELEKAGVLKEFEKAMAGAKETYDKIAKEMPLQAQYVVPLAYKIRWYFTLNAREMYHLVELRSTPQGHADYRRVSIEMFHQAKKATPLVFELMKFVYEKGAGLERLEAEKKADEKLERIGKK